MRRVLPLFAVFALLALTFVACDSNVAGDQTNDDVANKAEKTYVCHVGNETVDGQAWPYCKDIVVDGVVVGQECADAGKIDLIHVANPSRHFYPPPYHEYEGTADYPPFGDPEADDANEDTDGDGVDEACEEPGFPDCDNPSVCGDLAACGPDGCGGLCFQNNEGGGACFDGSTLCTESTGACPNGISDCGEGEQCIDSCCGQNLCFPVQFACPPPAGLDALIPSIFASGPTMGG